MFDNIAFHEGIEPLARVPAASYTNAQNSGWVSVANNTRVVGIMSPNVVVATGTLDFKIQKATDAAGTNATDVRAITQLTAATYTKEYILEVLAVELGQTVGGLPFTHVRVVVTPAVAASTVSALLLGVSPRQSPVSQANWAQVVKLT